MSKKFLYCKHCRQKRYCDLIVRFNYTCRVCGKDVNMIEAKSLEKDRRNNREVDDEYIAWIKGWECLSCKKWPVDAHHTVSRGAGGSDYTSIPLCHSCHMQCHSMGAESFQREKCLIFDAEIQALLELYRSGVSSKHHFLTRPTTKL